MSMVATEDGPVQQTSLEDQAVPDQRCPRCDSPITRASMKVSPVTPSATGHRFRTVTAACPACAVVVQVDQVRNGGEWEVQRAEVVNEPDAKAAIVRSLAGARGEIYVDADAIDVTPGEPLCAEDQKVIDVALSRLERVIEGMEERLAGFRERRQQLLGVTPAEAAAVQLNQFPYTSGDMRHLYQDDYATPDAFE